MSERKFQHITEYKFEKRPGWPPDGEPGLFFGFDDNGTPAILHWLVRKDFAGWHGVRLARYPHHAPGFQREPEVFIRGESTEDRVTSWAAAPLEWSDVDQGDESA